MSDTATEMRTKSAKKWDLLIELSGKVYKGGRKYLEDYMSAKTDLKTRSSFLAVFDGHCGKEAAKFACENLWEAIMNSEGFGNKDSVKVVEAIKAGFLKTHEAMWEVRPSWKRNKSGGPSNSGTTVACVIFQLDRMFVANVGDSAVVLGKTNPKFGEPGEPEVIAQVMTRKHAPSNKNERERIEKLGGSVSSSNRVVWEPIQTNGKQTNEELVDRKPKLNMTRSLGDLWSITEDKKYVISPIPDVCVHYHDFSKDKFIIMGTDGLWDMIAPQEGVEMLHRFFDGDHMNEDKLDQAPKILMNEALERWSKRRQTADNVSVMIASFRPWPYEVANDDNSYCGRLLQSSTILDENHCYDLTKPELRKRTKELQTDCLSSPKKHFTMHNTMSS